MRSHTISSSAPDSRVHLTFILCLFDCSSVPPTASTIVTNCVISPSHHANPFAAADPDASPPPPPSSVAAATSAAPTLTTATSSSSPPANPAAGGSLQQLEAAAAAGCNESSGRQLSPSSDTGQDLSAPRQQSEVSEGRPRQSLSLSYAH